MCFSSLSLAQLIFLKHKSKSDSVVYWVRNLFASPDFCSEGTFYEAFRVDNRIQDLLKF